MPKFKPIKAYANVITNSPLFKDYMLLLEGRPPPPYLHPKEEKKRNGFYDDLGVLAEIDEALDGIVANVTAYHHFRKGYRTLSFYSLTCLGKDLLSVYECLHDLRLPCFRVHPLQLQEENGGDIALRAKRNGTSRADRYDRRSNPPDDIFAPPPRSISGLRDAIKKFTKIVRDRIEAGGGNIIQLQPVVATALFQFIVDGVVVLTFNGETGQLVE
eukprot:scaffold16359_cov47-Cyclotella_meneghiniana.AAC.3